MSELAKIRFDNHYPKLHNQKHARLVMVIQDISGEMLLKKYPDFTGWDSIRDDGRYYDIKPEETYMLLLFIGDKDIMFPTFRKQNEENAALYSESVGELFEVVVEEPKEG